MKKIFIAILIIFCLSSCSIKHILAGLPAKEYKKYEYHRTGNVTSAHITAINCRRVNGILEIEEICIQADYGPFVSWNISFENLRYGAFDK